jgi:hypothetical protein
MKQLLITAIIILTFFQAYSQQRIFVSTDSRLYTLDLNNCTRHYVGYDSLGIGDIAFTPDGRLWGQKGGNLYQIDTSNGHSVFIGKTRITNISLEGLNDTTLLVESNSNLYGIRTKDATSYYIGNIGHQASGDLTWYDNALYMAAGDSLIKIVLNNSNSAILSVSVIKNKIPICFALTNVDFLDTFYSIVGFTGVAAYKICHIDGTYIKICPNIGGFDGAATIRLPIQKPEPTSCQLATIKIDKQNSKKSSIEIFPNPVSENGVLQIKLPGVISLPYRVNIINLQGITQYYRIEQLTKEISIDLNNISLLKGTYIIEIINYSNILHSLLTVD